jgi:hypothetical protein
MRHPLNELWSEIRFRLRAVFRRDAIERELDAELRFHLEHEAEKYVRNGLSRDAALRQARLNLGGVGRIKDDDRDARGIAWPENAVRDVRYALRGLRARPLFTAVRVSPRDPFVYSVVAGTLIVVGILASAIPAWRATRVDPNVALRTD